MRKPSHHSDYATKLVEHLIGYSDKRTYPPSSYLRLLVGNESRCYLLLEGYVSMYHENNDLMLANMSAPTIIGLNQLVKGTIYLKTRTHCMIGVLNREKTLSVIKENNLWELLSYYFMAQSDKFLSIGETLTAPTSYEIIRYQLLELMNEPEDYRQRIAVERYIRDKTLLSRSGIMKILRNLKVGGYIKIINGKLIAIYNLPQHY